MINAPYSPGNASLPPIRSPAQVSSAPPKVRLMPVARYAFICFVTIRVSRPPTAENTALSISIPSPESEKSDEPPPALTSSIPPKPSRQPKSFLFVKLSSGNTTQAAIISIKVHISVIWLHLRII